MAYAFVYTREGSQYYQTKNSENYKGFQAYNCDVQDAMHLAVSRDGKEFIPMRNNTGILFPKADFTEKVPGGVTKTLKDPWVFRRADGTFGICAVRYGQNEPDAKTIGCVMLFQSDDLISYQETGFLKLSDGAIRHPRCRWSEQENRYYLEWETPEGISCGYTKHFLEVFHTARCSHASFTPAGGFGIADAVPGNVIEISEKEAQKIEGWLGEIRHIGVDPLQMTVKAGQSLDDKSLPKAVCRYSDGSTHEKPVHWDADDFLNIDFSVPGTYEIHGEIMQTHYPFPFLDDVMSDPCICRYDGRYFLSATGQRHVTFRISDTIEGLASAEPVHVYTIPDADRLHANMWAQEMHVIHGVPYVFTTVGEQEWHTVHSHVLRCNGDPANPNDWEAPRPVCRPDGTKLQPEGISLDMTYFCVAGVHYVMWSDRKILERTDAKVTADSADIYIAAIDPDAPWQLTTNPVCILRPMYGWDRYETTVDEGPYLLRHEDDLFITISGSSTGLADLYCLGLLHAKQDANLLLPDSWDWLGYPVLTKESVNGEYGPGHNSFIKEPGSGDDLMVYHAVPHDKDDRSLGRHMGIRRVHWAVTGYPYLEMTKERDLDPACKHVVLKIQVQ